MSSARLRTIRTGRRVSRAATALAARTLHCWYSFPPDRGTGTQHAPSCKWFIFPICVSAKTRREDDDDNADDKEEEQQEQEHKNKSTRCVARTEPAANAPALNLHEMEPAPERRRDRSLHGGRTLRRALRCHTLVVTVRRHKTPPGLHVRVLL